MIEHSRLAVYALHNNNESDFYYYDEKGVAHQKRRVKSKSRAYLDNNFKDEANTLNGNEGLVSKNFAHADIMNALSNTDPTEVGVWIDFFDNQDSNLTWITRHHLWFLANQSLGLLRLFEKANTNNLLKISKEISLEIASLFKENEKLESKIKQEINERRNTS